MDSCHFLFGIPWKYDKSMIHDSYANIVTVEKDGKNIKMIPLKEYSSNKGSENNYWEKRVLMYSTKKFLKEEKKHHYCFSSHFEGD